MESITFKNQNVPWELYTLQSMQIFLWESLKETSYIHFFRHFHIILLWNRSKTPSLNFITKLNSRYPTIKFDFKYSKSCINFLDKNLQSKEKNKSLTIYIYQNSTDRRNVFGSYRKSLINSIPFCQALQLKKICSDTSSELCKHLDEMKESFINPGYKENFLTDQFNGISEVTREALLTSKPKIKIN